MRERSVASKRPSHWGPVVTSGLLLAAVSGCGYGLSGTTTVLPENIQRFVVQPFENRTDRPEIDQRVTEQVAALLSRRGRYRVVSNVADADAVLSGAVTSYRTQAVQFNTEGRATRVEALVEIEATVRETATDRLLWSQGGFLFREQFDVSASGSVVDTEAIARETGALEDIARGAAEALINSIFEGF